VVDAIGPRAGDVFLEIGPGTGALTFPLARSGAPILAIELDRSLAGALAGRVPGHVTVLSGDALTADLVGLLSGLSPQQPAPGAGPAPSVKELPPPRRYRIAGNLPYAIASPILFRLADLHVRHGLFADATVMVQREVGDRLVAKPGTRDYGVMTILLSLRARFRKVFDLPPGAFRPPPQVRSSIVHIEFGPAAVRLPDEPLFERVVKTMFSHRRKTLANALKGFDPTMPAVLALAGLDGRRRPETLQVSEIARLVELLTTTRQPPVL
jgi:16S rRNA (adenine1518-N6/adenine1519-N6)-dimethyltransferase